MALETLLALGGVLMMLGVLGIASHARPRDRGVRGRLFALEVIPLPPKRAGRP